MRDPAWRFCHAAIAVRVTMDIWVGNSFKPNRPKAECGAHCQQGTDVCRSEPMLCFLGYRSPEASGLDALFSIDLDSILCPMADLSGGEHFLHRRPIKPIDLRGLLRGPYADAEML